MKKILLVDDDNELSKLLEKYFLIDGFEILPSNSSISGLHLFQENKIDLVILDVMLNDGRGFDFLKMIRNSSNIPIIIFTEKNDASDRINGLEMGADDYIVKPCSARELIARVNAILRRGFINDLISEKITIGNLNIEPNRRIATWHGKAIDLTSSEYNLLEYLAKNIGITVSKEELSQKALGRKLEKFDRSIDVHFSRIREKLNKFSDGRSCIQTVYRQGYQLICE